MLKRNTKPEEKPLTLYSQHLVNSGAAKSFSQLPPRFTNKPPIYKSMLEDQLPKVSEYLSVQPKNNIVKANLMSPQERLSITRENSMKKLRPIQDETRISLKNASFSEHDSLTSGSELRK